MRVGRPAVPSCSPDPAVSYAELLLSRACGVPHPALVTADQIDVLDDRLRTRSVRDHFGYGDGWGLPSAGDLDEIRTIMERMS